MRRRASGMGCGSSGQVSQSLDWGGFGAPPGDTRWSPARSWLTRKARMPPEKAGPEVEPDPTGGQLAKTAVERRQATRSPI